MSAIIYGCKSNLRAGSGGRNSGTRRLLNLILRIPPPPLVKWQNCWLNRFKRNSWEAANSAATVERVASVARHSFKKNKKIDASIKCRSANEVKRNNFDSSRFVLKGLFTYNRVRVTENSDQSLSVGCFPITKLNNFDIFPFLGKQLVQHWELG